MASKEINESISKTAMLTALVYEKCYGWYNPPLLYKMLQYTIGDKNLNKIKDTGINVIVKSLDEKVICVVSYSQIRLVENSTRYQMVPFVLEANPLRERPGGIYAGHIKWKIQAVMKISYYNIKLYDDKHIELDDDICIKLTEQELPLKNRNPKFRFIQPESNNPQVAITTVYAKIVSNLQEK